VHSPLLEVNCHYFVSFVLRNFEFSIMSFCIDFSWRISFFVRISFIYSK
jgi:hypothetical protein